MLVHITERLSCEDRIDVQARAIHQRELDIINSYFPNKDRSFMRTYFALRLHCNGAVCDAVTRFTEPGPCYHEWIFGRVRRQGIFQYTWGVKIDLERHNYMVEAVTVWCYKSAPTQCKIRLLRNKLDLVPAYTVGYSQWHQIVRFVYQNLPAPEAVIQFVRALPE